MSSFLPLFLYSLVNQLERVGPTIADSKIRPEIFFGPRNDDVKKNGRTSFTFGRC